MTRVQLLRTMLTALAALALAGAAQAQQVYWDSPRPLGAGQRTALDLVFADSEPVGRITPPTVDGLTVLGPPSQQSSVSIINGQRSSSMTLSFPVRAEREGALRLPAFEVQTSAGPATVDTLALDVGPATLPGRGAGTKLSDAVQARLTPTNMTPYAGEVFDVDLTIALSGGRSGQVEGTPNWSPTGASAEAWSAGQAAAGGSAVRFRTRASVPAAGRIELAPARQDVQIESARERNDPFAGLGGRFGGADFFDSFFARTQMTGATVESNAVQLDVQPLPEPAPAGFSGAVGQFALESTVTPAAPKTGDPITWTVSLKGSGNWPSVSLPARAVPNQVRALQPKLHKEFAAGALFDGQVSEDLVLVPNEPGDLALAPISFVYFNPASGAYETATAQPPTLHITGAPIAQPALPQSAAVASSAQSAAASASAAAPAPALLPRDPLRGAANAYAPLTWTDLRAVLLAPFALLAAYWLALAVRRARQRDPRRARRLALEQLRVLIDQARSATTAEARVAALLAWQHAAAKALNVDLAAPTAVQLRSVGGEPWVEIWAGSERALYARGHALPNGWAERALALCTRRRRFTLNPLRVFRTQQLFPKAATAALLLACLAARADADGLERYGEGDFAGARAEFLAAAQAAPSDWIARYNLGLADAQLGHDGRALGETLSALAHAPSSPAVRWNAAAFAARVPGLDGRAAAVLASDFVTALPPAGWQALLVLAAVLFCSGAALWLRRRYAARGRAGVWSAALIGAGVLCALASTIALQRYGALADPNAALVAQTTVLRSVPTDAEAPGQQRPLAAGALVLAQRDFLGWVQITLPSGETGWLRDADLVPLYGAPRA